MPPVGLLRQGSPDASSRGPIRTRLFEPVLSVRDLRVAFRTEDATVRAVRGLTFDLAPGEILGIVGESGSGKSAAAMALTALNRSANATLEGEVLLGGRNLLTLRERQLRPIRGAEIAMIFQDPMTSLTPVYRVGSLIGEVLRAHEPLSRSQARGRARSSCSPRSAFPTRPAASTTIRTSSRAACASA